MIWKVGAFLREYAAGAFRRRYSSRTSAKMICFKSFLLWLTRCVPSDYMEPTLPKRSFLWLQGYFIIWKKAMSSSSNMMVKRIASIKGTDAIKSYYVLGDNFENSSDSRQWENPYVSDCDILAKVWIFNETPIVSVGLSMICYTIG